MRIATRFLGLLLCPLLFTQCKKDSIAANTEQPAALTQGQWQVTSVHGTAATGTHSTYRLRFGNDGTLTCLQDATESRGTWQWQRRVETGSLRLQLIDGRAAIALLHNEWEVKSCTPTTLTLARAGVELRFARP
ncbi:hypothetical protein [Flaviaesturariibacter amylovorans]|uniref:Lipocalin-like domain-containing protein n=1 Tax=Flaviaesturariibacter amylovorans TaxID=1084520 RepID=A0ABP8HKC2_9BACT